MNTERTTGVEREVLREAIRDQYEAVANEPGRGFHFHTGRPLAAILGYRDEWLEGIPEGSIESFAGTGNPFRTEGPRPGERVVDVGCGAGIDSLIAAKLVGAEGRVVGVDMTCAMLEKAGAAAAKGPSGNNCCIRALRRAPGTSSSSAGSARSFPSRTGGRTS